MKMNMSPSRRFHQGYTLIEVLLALGATAALVGGVAAIVSPAMQASRDSSLNASSNIQLSRSSDQLIDDISSGSSILRQAGAERIDLLKLTPLQPAKLPPHLGNGKENKIQLDSDSFSALIGQDVVLTNGSGDYLITKVENSERVAGKYITTFECPLYLPGTLSAHTFTPLNIASTEATGGGGQPDSLYRDSGSGWQLATTGISKVTFQPGDGSEKFTDLQPVGRRINTLMVGLTAKGERADNLAQASIKPLAWKEWSCGQGGPAGPNNLGTLQLNVSLEGDSNPANPGATPNVAANGPQDQSLNRFGTQVFEKLKPGLYNVSANVLTIGSHVYDPVITGSPANIGNGRAGTVNVNYVERRGIMTITVSGLPAGQKGQVHIRGRENQDLELANGTWPVEVKPGNYTVTADGRGQYDAVVSPTNVSVRAGEQSPVSVAYKLAQGQIVISIDGLANGEKTKVTLSGPTSVNQELGQGSHYINVDAGTYTVSATDVPGRNVTISAPTLTVAPRRSEFTQISFAQQKGTMQLTVKGLEPGETSYIQALGPNNVSQSLGNGTFNISLSPGNYTVKAQDVGGKKPTISPANPVIGNGTTTAVVVNYVPTTPIPCDPAVDASCSELAVYSRGLRPLYKNDVDVLFSGQAGSFSWSAYQNEWYTGNVLGSPSFRLRGELRQPKIVMGTGIMNRVEIDPTYPDDQKIEIQLEPINECTWDGIDSKSHMCTTYPGYQVLLGGKSFDIQAPPDAPVGTIITPANQDKSVFIKVNSGKVLDLPREKAVQVSTNDPTWLGNRYGDRVFRFTVTAGELRASGDRFIIRPQHPTDDGTWYTEVVSIRARLAP